MTEENLDDTPPSDAAREGEGDAERARGYLIRNVLLPLHPNIEPLPDLGGVCTQVDNVTAGLVQERDAAMAEARRAALEEAACWLEIRGDRRAKQDAADVRALASTPRRAGET